MKSSICKSRPIAAAATGAAILLSSSAVIAQNVTSGQLRRAVTVEGVRGHQLAFQSFADLSNDTRASGTLGYDLSAEYVAFLMNAAGYEVTMQPFQFNLFTEVTEAEMSQTSPASVDYEYLIDFFTMTYSGSGDVTAPVTGVDLDFGPAGDGLGNSSSSGCEPGDFAGFPSGNIALMQRGACSFQQKAENAYDAGASGAIIFNQGNAEDRKVLFGGTLSAEFSDPIPVVSATFDRGLEWANTAGLNLRMFADTTAEDVTTSNVIADTPGGRNDRIVVVGGHLDSVGEGPGVQDNGSGSAAILEVALQMAALGVEPVNKIRFAWWGAEESGLLGSQFYVDNLSAEEIADIAVNLNFDMIGSPNFVRFVYDGDGSATPLAGPQGSKRVERLFERYFAFKGLAIEPTAFSGRSDYGPFIAVGIPAGGLFTGAEGIKTDEQAAIFGGTAGEQYDPCYHLACDTYDNISLEVLGQNADAIAHSTLKFAMTYRPFRRPSPAVAAAARQAGAEAVSQMEYLGSKLRM